MVTSVTLSFVLRTKQDPTAQQLLCNRALAPMGIVCPRKDRDVVVSIMLGIVLISSSSSTST
jgi:hypothetical protein